MEYFVYVLESETDGSFYIGQTQNLKTRILKHNAGYSSYTKSKRPWKIKYFIKVRTRKEAMTLERKIKNFKSRALIIDFFEQSRQSTRLVPK